MGFITFISYSPLIENMDNVLHLIFGNHPKSGTIKSRAEINLRFLKSRVDWVALDDIEKEINISRQDNPSMFYKPLSALKKWRLVDSVRRATGKTRQGNNTYTTYYKWTPERFLVYLRDTLHAKCETELKMFK